jgi:hypothetical protein
MQPIKTFITINNENIMKEKSNEFNSNTVENKPEMVNKQEFIEKACKIYRKHLIKFNPALKEFSNALDEYVNIFRKQMEE